MSGWICLHRKIRDAAWYGKPDYLAVWIHMLLKANHKEKQVAIGNQIITVKRGQFVAGRKSLAAETGVQESKVNRIINVFKTEQQLEQQAFSKFSLFSIVNYEQYQNSEHQSEQQVNSKRTADEQQMNTNNNDNNVTRSSSSTSRGEFCLHLDWQPTFSEMELRALKNTGITDSVIADQLAVFIAHHAGTENRRTQHSWNRSFKSTLIKFGLGNQNEKSKRNSKSGFDAAAEIANAPGATDESVGF